MGSSDMNVFAARLATFEGPLQLGRRRASTIKKKAPTTISWPHTFPTPEQLARAGFYYNPSTASQDSVTCFLCNKALDGWDPEDDPALEHLAHVPDCGWAINTCIELRSQDMDRAEENPRSERIVEARRATFQDKWPHEGRKGWKCKMQKMVDAGWSYEPLPEADDCVKCFYCGVCLDGWEPKDDPWEEHQRRSPDCHFFTLIDEAAKAGKTANTTAKRAPRMSKVLRLSTQSNITAKSDAGSVAQPEDELAEEGDTVLTMTSTKGKTVKGKAKTSAKTKTANAPRQTRKLSTALTDDFDAMDVDETSALKTHTETRCTSPKLGEKKGRKRGGPLKEEGTVGVMIYTSIPEVPEVAEPAAKKTSKSKLKLIKDAGYLELSVEPIPSDLEGSMKLARRNRITKEPHGLESSMLASELEETATQYSKPKLARGKKRMSNGQEKLDSSFAMSTQDSKPKSTRGEKLGSDEEVSDIAINIQIEAPLPLAPKQTSKAKVPKATKKRTTAIRKDASPEPREEVASQQVSPSSGTIPNIAGGAATIDESRREKDAEPLAQRNYDSTASRNIRQATYHSQTDMPQVHGPQKRTANDIRDMSSSPQSSDAENQPPSFRPSLAAASQLKSPDVDSHAAAAPTTPTISASEQRGLSGGLQSLHPWRQVDLETVFLLSPSAEAKEVSTAFTVKEALGRLSNPEKNMSVEEWIIWNARGAEERLKGECERLINKFEREGVRALQALEGIECV